MYGIPGIGGGPSFNAGASDAWPMAVRLAQLHLALVCSIIASFPYPRECAHVFTEGIEPGMERNHESPVIIL